MKNVSMDFFPWRNFPMEKLFQGKTSLQRKKQKHETKQKIKSKNKTPQNKQLRKPEPVETGTALKPDFLKPNRAEPGTS